MADSPDAHAVCERVKSTERARILAARRAVDPAVRAEANAALVAAVVTAIRASAGMPGALGTTIAGYVPFGTEPGGPALPEALATVFDPCELLLPVLRPDRDLEWAPYRGMSDLGAASMGLTQPKAPSMGTQAIRNADVVVVPALAIDTTGIRLGRGGGSYDRALARVGPHTEVIALLYAGEIVRKLPRMTHDRPVTLAMVAEGSTVHCVRFPAN